MREPYQPPDHGTPGQPSGSDPSTTPRHHPSRHTAAGPTAPPTGTSNSHGFAGSLATSLEPHLRRACQDRLSAIEWFRSDWQAGGASTGRAMFNLADGTHAPAIVKVPVGPAEYRWTVALGGGQTSSHGPADLGCPALCDFTPRVLASGTELGGYDLAWLVIERLDGSPSTARPAEHDVRGLLAAASEFYRSAANARSLVDCEPPPAKDWAGLIAKGRDIIHSHGIAEEQRWNTAIRTTQRVLPRLIERWMGRPINTWCHGDLHLGNVMHRPAPAQARGHTCVLIDLALVHPGHWVEDAVYLERLYWAKPELLCGVKPVSELARLKREQGHMGQEDYSTLANIRRVLMAASVPAFLLHEGHPKYVHAALELLEKLLPLVGK